MGSTRRAILTCYALAAALACVWVPWDVQKPSGSRQPVGYEFLWSPPRDEPPVKPGRETLVTIIHINSAVDDLKEYDPELALNLQKRGNALKADWQRKREQEYAEWKEEDKQTTIKVSRDRVLLEIAALTVLCAVTLSWTFLKPDRGAPEPSEERAARSDLAREGVIDAEYVEVDEKDEPKPPTPEGEP